LHLETGFFLQNPVSSEGFLLPAASPQNQKPWSLAFSFFRFESLESTLPTARTQRATGKESHFLAPFFFGTACGLRSEQAGRLYFLI
jgi:hypothetical protein